MPGAWPRARAALIALTLIAGLIVGWPVPTDAQIERLAEPWAGGARWLRDEKALLVRPLEPIGRTLFLLQRWNLFSTASTSRYRLRIEARAAHGRYQLLYRPHDPEHRRFAGLLEYRRVRGAWNPRSRSAQSGYRAFASFIARRIFLAEPRYTVVRVRLEHVTILPRGRGFRGTGRFAFQVVERRSEVLP